MRVTLAFAPAICLPNQLYLAGPLLAGALQRAGHSPRCVDLNDAAADLLLDERHAEHLLGRMDRLIDGVRARGDAAHAELIRRNREAVGELVLSGERHKRALQDPQRFFDQPLFHDSFWSVVDVLAACYQLDEVLSPYHDQFAARMLENQRADHWTAMRELWQLGLLDQVFASRPELVGITVAFPEQCIEAVRLARLIRARDPAVRIAVGGPLITRLPDKWLDGDWLLDYVDYVVVGDGETAIVGLCDALEGRGALEAVPNLIWRGADGRRRVSRRQHFLEQIDDVPTPAFDCVDIQRTLQPLPVYPLMTSRGCYWGKCTMCSIGYQENYRMRSRARIRDDLLAVAQHGGRFVQLQDSSVPPKGARMVAEVIADEGLDLQWIGWMKFESCFVNRAYCDTLARGGCRSLHMGLEASDQRLLDLMCKGYRHTDVLTMLHNLRGAGISVDLLWFIGFPTQTRADVLDTARFLHDHRQLFGLTSFVGRFGLHPDSEVYRRPERFGVTITAQINGHCTYEVDSGMSLDEAEELKELLQVNNNRTLACNGVHILHLGTTGLDLTGLARPMVIPDEVVAFCSASVDVAVADREVPVVAVPVDAAATGRRQHAHDDDA